MPKLWIYIVSIYRMSMQDAEMTTTEFLSHLDRNVELYEAANEHYESEDFNSCLLISGVTGDFGFEMHKCDRDFIAATKSHDVDFGQMAKALKNGITLIPNEVETVLNVLEHLRIDARVDHETYRKLHDLICQIQDSFMSEILAICSPEMEGEK